MYFLFFIQQINQACANTGAFVPIDTSMKRTILDTHNSVRDKLAGGGVETYPTASKMLEMVSNKKKVLNYVETFAPNSHEFSIKWQKLIYSYV